MIWCNALALQLWSWWLTVIWLDVCYCCTGWRWYTPEGGFITFSCTAEQDVMWCCLTVSTWAACTHIAVSRWFNDNEAACTQTLVTGCSQHLFIFCEDVLKLQPTVQCFLMWVKCDVYNETIQYNSALLCCSSYSLNHFNFIDCNDNLLLLV